MKAFWHSFRNHVSLRLSRPQPVCSLRCHLKAHGQNLAGQAILYLFFGSFCKQTRSSRFCFSEVLSSVLRQLLMVKPWCVSCITGDCGRPQEWIWARGFAWGYHVNCFRWPWPDLAWRPWWWHLRGGLFCSHAWLLLEELNAYCGYMTCDILSQMESIDTCISSYKFYQGYLKHAWKLRNFTLMPSFFHCIKIRAPQRYLISYFQMSFFGGIICQFSCFQFLVSSSYRVWVDLAGGNGLVCIGSTHSTRYITNRSAVFYMQYECGKLPYILVGCIIMRQLLYQALFSPEYFWLYMIPRFVFLITELCIYKQGDNLLFVIRSAKQIKANLSRLFPRFSSNA